MGFDSDESVAAELKLYTENDGDIYRRTTTSILRALATRRAAGRYNSEKAIDAFMNLAEVGAKKYAREFGGPGAKWGDMFPKPIRRMAAKEWRDEFEVEYALGNYNHLVPKKYQGR